jgi:S-adenosylmethionine/arginine decarboxylase-like enzyme
MIRSHHLCAILPAQIHVLEMPSAALLNLMQTAVDRAGLRAVGEIAKTFEPQGISAILILEESHVALHVWTERQKVTIDIHVCDYQANNLPKAEKLASLLEAAICPEGDRADWHYFCLSETLD